MSNETNQSANASSTKANASEIEILDKVRKNVEKLKEAKKNAGGSFLKIQPNEVKILQFTGDMEPVQRTFKRKNDKNEEETSTKLMYAYKVLDMEHQEEGIKVWDLSRSWSDNVDNLLVKGFLTLEVKRTGAGTDTNYLFAPVVSPKTT